MYPRYDRGKLAKKCETAALINFLIKEFMSSSLRLSKTMELKALKLSSDPVGLVEMDEFFLSVYR